MRLVLILFQRKKLRFRDIEHSLRGTHSKELGFETNVLSSVGAASHTWSFRQFDLETSRRYYGNSRQEGWSAAGVIKEDPLWELDLSLDNE